MKWELSDGTVVLLGGHVQGTSIAAERLRKDVHRAKAGFAVYVQIERHPSAPRVLDLDDAQLVHEWILASMLGYNVDITSAPELEPIERFDPPDPDDDGLDEEGRQRIH